MADVTDELTVHICRLYLTDYCCFDFDMPTVCLAAAGVAAGTVFKNTASLCEYKELDQLWSSADTGSTTPKEDFFAPLPDPTQSPHLYAGASKVVRSYNTQMSQLAT